MGVWAVLADMSTKFLRDGQEAAVIDVGSNSVRLVVYRIDGRAMTPILNEKVMAGLGREGARTGSLSKDGVDQALRAVRRFATLIDALQIMDVYAVGTAAEYQRHRMVRADDVGRQRDENW